MHAFKMFLWETVAIIKKGHLRLVIKTNFFPAKNRISHFFFFIISRFLPDGFIHWNQKSTETSQSLSVEISSYVLLAKLGSSPTVEDLGYASSIVRWLTSQQNSYGGYTSTQVHTNILEEIWLPRRNM